MKRARVLESEGSSSDDESGSDETASEVSDVGEPPTTSGQSEDMFGDFVEEIYTGEESEEDDNEVELDAVDEEIPSLATPTLPSPIPPTQPAWIWNRGSNVLPADPFDDLNSDWNTVFDESTTEFDLLQQTFPCEVIMHTVDELNRYADSDIANSINLSRRQGKWKAVTYGEFMRFLCIRIIMGIDRKPQYSHYWTADPFLKSSVVPTIMTSDRFFEIQRYLHFSNNSDQQPGDRLHKIRDVWELFTTRWSELLDPSRDLSVDESLIKFKGRLSFKQFIPSKRNRFGIKTFSVVDAKTGFVLNSKIYAGKGRDDLAYDMKIYGYGGAILLELCQPYLQKYHRIFADNYFTSPTLAAFLLEQKTYICGTIRSNRKNCPKVPKPFAKGDIATFHAAGDKAGIMIEYWRDSKVVRMISSGMQHSTASVRSKSGTLKDKPQTVIEYNTHARGIDLSDMHVHLYETSRKSVKWYKKVFFRGVEIAIYNAFTMMKIYHPKKTFLDFRMNLVRQILANTGGTTANKKFPADHPLRLKERHFLSHNPSSKIANHGMRRCHVCSKKNKQTRTSFRCKDCEVSLCAVPCFQDFHTKLNYA